jgi:lipopolysaccharide export system permease protein
VGSIIDRYLVREVVLTWLAVTLVLWLILVSARLSRYLAQAAAGELPGAAVFRLLGLKSVEFLVFIMPLALFLGVMLGLGRLYKDSEMAALAACGVGTARLYRPLMALALVAALFLGWAALYLVPHTAALGYEVRTQAQQTADISGVGAGRFKEIRGGALVFYAESISRDRASMEKVFVHARDEGVERVIVADRAYQTWDADTGDRFLVLVDGTRYEGLPGRPITGCWSSASTACCWSRGRPVASARRTPPPARRYGAPVTAASRRSCSGACRCRWRPWCWCSWPYPCAAPRRARVAMAGWPSGCWPSSSTTT